MSNSKLTRVVRARLAENDYKTFLAKSQKANMTESAFLRDCILRNRTQIISKPQRTQFRARLLFLLAKLSNNVNQVAHRLNTDARSGFLYDVRYEQLLVELKKHNDIILELSVLD